LGANYSARNNAGVASLDLVGGDTKLIALFGEAVAASTGAKVRRSPKINQQNKSGSDTDGEAGQNESQEFEWHGKKPWSEAKDQPVTRLQVFLELRSNDDEASTIGKPSPAVPNRLIELSE
jgi:hypothetical protein